VHSYFQKSCLFNRCLSRRYVEQHDALSKHKEEFAKQTLFLERDVCNMAAESGKDIAAFNNIQSLLVDIILHRSGASQRITHQPSHSQSQA
jgi:hypothetical protein